MKVCGGYWAGAPSASLRLVCVVTVGEWEREQDTYGGPEPAGYYPSVLFIFFVEFSMIIIPPNRGILRIKFHIQESKSHVTILSHHSKFQEEKISFFLFNTIIIRKEKNATKNPMPFYP
jgi:hypothetical protein